MIRRAAAIAGILLLLAVVVVLAFLLHQHRENTESSLTPHTRGPLVMMDLELKENRA